MSHLFNPIISFIHQQTKKYLLKSSQRMAVVLHVESQENGLSDFIASISACKKLIVSPVIADAIKPEKALIKLGEEFDLVVFDARQNFDADVLGIVSGVLRATGCLVLLLPNKNELDGKAKLYGQYVLSNLNNQAGIHYFVKKQNKYELQNSNVSFFSESRSYKEVAEPYRTIDQKNAVEGMLKGLELAREYHAVLTSARGRGKSASLGLVAAGFFADEVKSNSHIIITAPRLSISDPIFEHLHSQLLLGNRARASYQYQSSLIEFMAPDFLVENLPSADVIFVDEAAAIPLPMLAKLLHHYPKIIFSSTTHGYEGTGRGFALKFYKLLDELRPNWKKIELHQPIRWSDNDPLESWIENILFLNIKMDKKPFLPKNINESKVVLINRSHLIKDRNKLSSVFSLLVQAHYRTSPTDFQYLLDSPDIRIYSLEYAGQCLALLVVNQEGDFSAELSSAIYQGQRRPKGHLMAQTLCFHGGVERAAGLSYARVMRIAVHAEVQGCGLGSFLLAGVMQKEKNIGMDVIASSFSATVEMLKFWKKSELTMLRMGFRCDHVSASHSAVVARVLSDEAQDIVDELSARFKRNLLAWLEGPLLGLNASVKQYLLDSYHYTAGGDKSFDLKDVESFARFNRNFEVCMPGISRWLNQIQVDVDCLSAEQLKIIRLVEKYKADWKAIADIMKLTGKAETIRYYKSALIVLLENLNRDEP